MKKTYQTPETVVVKIATIQMIAASGDEVLTNKGNYGDGTGITLGSRQGNSLWDDNE